MTEIRLDPISTLMPLGARSMAPVSHFAAYLDEAWTRSTTTVTTAATPDLTARYSPSATEMPRDAAAPVERRTEEPKDDERKDDRERPRPPEGVVGQAAPAPSDAAVAPAEDTADETAASGSGEKADPTAQASENETGDNAEPAAKAEHSTENEAEAARPNVGAPDEVLPTETGATDAEAEASSLNAQIDQEIPASDAAEVPAAVHRSEKADEDSVAAPSLASNAEVAPPDDGAADAERPDAMKTGRDAPADAKQTDASEEQAAADADGGDQPGQERPSGDSDAPTDSGSRRGKPPTAKEAGATRGASANASPPEKTPDQPVPAAATSTVAANAATPVAPVVATAAATMDAGQPGVATAGVATIETVEGPATGTARSTSTDSAARAAAASGTSEADQAGAVDRARFVQRVVQAFQANGDRGGTIRMRLSPPELGALRAEITVRQGVMTARMETETDAARQLLLENLPMLRERLAEQGIKVEQFQVDVSDRQNEGLPGQAENRSHSDRSDAEHRQNPTRRDSKAEDADLHADRRARRVGETSRLDVFV